MSPVRVVVADDHAVVRAGFAELLDTQPDFTVVGTASDGEEAVRVCTSLRPDVVLMDVRMPVMDGIEATRRIRMLPGEAGVTPIIAISADVMPETTRTCLAAGMNAILSKPIERDALVATLRRLEVQRYRPQAREPAPVSHTVERWALGSG